MSNNKITVITHSADADGWFCQAIARKFLGDSATYIGWDFADKPLGGLGIPDGQIYVLDLPVDRVFGFQFAPLEEISSMNDWLLRVIWIDHHKSSIESHPTTIQGYRIDGVAACRLAWQYFAASMGGEEMNDARFLGWPKKEDFIDRKVSEPYAVQLAGEYDIWDKRNPHAEAFQFGLRSRELTEAIWRDMFVLDNGLNKPRIVHDLIESGLLLQTYQQKNDEGIMHRSFMVNFEGLKFLALNTARLNSLTFASKDTPETGHDALMGFYWNGEVWNVSLYHAKHRTDIDLSQIAVKHGGGGHRGACRMKMKQLLDFM